MKDDVKSEIINAIERLNLPTNGLKDGQNLFETTIFDSLIFVRLVVDIQKRLSLDLLGEIDELANCKTINSMSAFIAERKQRSHP